MVMMTFGIFDLNELKYSFSTPTPRGCATVPRPPRTAALGVAGERTGVAPELGERGYFKRWPHRGGK